MEELKNKNMTILEKVYARRFTASYLGEAIKNIITIRMQSLIMTIFLRKNSPKLSYGIKRTAAQIIGNYPIHNRRHMRIGDGANSNPCFIFSSQSSRFFTNILLIKLFKLIDTAELLDIPAVQ